MIERGFDRMSNEKNIYGYTTTEWLKLTEREKVIAEMNYLSNQLEGLSEEIPADLQKIIIINTKLLQPLGKMYSLATKDYKYKYGTRKFLYGDITARARGTGVERIARAEQGIIDARRKEAEAESDLVRWKHAYLSTNELVQSFKIVLRALITELENTNRMN